ncbi:transcription elongation factor SPT5 [Angomonas deanei]|uniref:KOW domain-containing protein n=1 Tax=Angomonas deanei TaxID=59799 RepID=A0A7G2CSY5_9TRYP|nr:transcription elongation factor SPT5 [Angomonas deanei]CAD2221533.1 hypothetical protein, conserved [Angomonas deanei]|eukprot:EPY35083.1 transcription elongation factor SPT5 [Angomonas deanei]
MMERRPSNDRIRVGSFVRLRPKQYRDDLAQVIALGRDGQHLTLKFVPRENFAGRTYEKQDRPCPQRLFVPTLALGVVETGERYRWGPLEFDLDGYLIKTVTVRSVIHGHTMPPPTTDELAVFYDNHRERVREAIQKYTLQNVDTGIFSIGDSVRITSGQLKGTIGTIRSITGDGTAQIACQVPGRQEPLLLKVELKLCSKHIVEGTHVVVQSGEHQGISGTVVRAAGEDILLFPDNNDFVKEVLVRAMDCHESKLSGTARHTHGIHQLFDLVSYNGTPACIIGLNMKLLQILTDQNEPKTVTYAQVRPTVKANMRRSLDSMNNVIVRGVEVLFQPHPDTPSDLVGEMGRVEQVFNETAFVRSQKLSKYSGIVSVRSECLLLTTGRTTHRRAAPRAELPRPDRRPHNAIRAEISVQPASTAWSQSQPHE